MPRFDRHARLAAAALAAAWLAAIPAAAEAAPAKGHAGQQTWCGWAILAYNLDTHAVRLA